MMKLFKQASCLTVLLAGLCVAAHAELPAGYYDSLEGKAGDALLSAIRSLAKGHTVISYNEKTWEAFRTTDVRELNGRQVWWDMYSNNIVYTETGHDAMNIEHTVANSWWGGEKNDAYKDLFHLNPSDQFANGKKSNYPPGKVASATLLDNGVFKVGTPAPGYGGSAKNVFEPADEYKGDFARAMMYVFTTYPDMAWSSENSYMYDKSGSGLQLKDWAKSLLLEWNRVDPVDSREKARNEAVYALQHNRNPFVDISGLPDLVYGDADIVCTVTETMPKDRPAAPVFKKCRMTHLNTYSVRWWEELSVGVDAADDLWLSIDGDDYYQYGNGITLESALNDGQTHSLMAYTVNPEICDISGNALRSPVARLNARAADPAQTDWSVALWSPVAENALVDEQAFYILLSANTLHAMSANGGTTSTKFMESAGFVDFTGNDVSELPADAAIVRFGNSGDSEYPRTLGVYDIKGNLKGYWNASGKNAMKLDMSTATPAQVRVDADGALKLTFSQNGSLQFNKSQPRFLNYTTNQGGVKLYKFNQFPTPSGIGAVIDTALPVSVSGRDILAPEGAMIFDLGGRRVSGSGLAPGIYIVTRNNAASVKVIVR